MNKQAKKLSIGEKKNWKGLLEAMPYLIPMLVGIIVFRGGPVLVSLIISFFSWDMILAPEWVGINNYLKMASDPLFWKIMRNTFLYIGIAVPASIVIPLFMALAVNQKLKGITVFRSIYFLPVVTSMVAVGLLWTWLYDPQFGLINYLLESIFHISGPWWLQSTKWALPSIIIMSLWKSVGYNMVIYLAGLQAIPQQFYDAGYIDGANKRQLFRHVTLPILSPTIFFVMIISVIGSFQVFEQAYIMTQGGPAYSTTTISYGVFVQAFEYWHMGYACGLAVILAGCVLVITLINFSYQRRWVFYG
ncbi:Lactose transport system permease protein LacF [subsurface metagenome]